MTRYGMLIDVERCTGCFACFLACRDEFAGNDYPPHSAAQPATGQSWIQVKEIERGSFPKVKVCYTPVPCLQCEKASCIEAGTDGAVYRRDDGIVIIDPEKAIGQKAIVEACPYGAIYWNETRNVAQKCTFCAHLLDDGWTEPRCVEACPVEAIIFGDLADKASVPSQSIAEHGQSEVLHPEFGLEPAVTYRQLPKKFVCGEVVTAGEPEQCAAGATVTLIHPAGTRTTTTDIFGDFAFDGLEADIECSLTIELRGYAPQTLSVCVESDNDLGTIRLRSGG